MSAVALKNLLCYERRSGVPEYERLMSKMVKAMEDRNKILKKIETDLSALARQAKTEETLDSITYNDIT